eukprot:15456945-Alexandrium_andersonii.AAC.1
MPTGAPMSVSLSPRMSMPMQAHGHAYERADERAYARACERAFACKGLAGGLQKDHNGVKYCPMDAHAQASCT